MHGKRYSILFVLTQGVDPHAGGVQMSTCKLGRYFSELGHDVGVFSFARAGHTPVDFGTLWTGVAEGGQDSEANRQAFEAVLSTFAPDIVINQMPYEREIGDLLKRNKRFLLLGCLRNTLFSVRGNPAAYVRRLSPGFMGGLADNLIIQGLFLFLHRLRHRKDLRWILNTYDLFIMFGPPNLDELEYFLPGFDHNKVRLIPNSIPQVSESTPQKEKRLLWLGRIAHAQKQAGLILEVWRRVYKRLPDWKIDVVGDGPALAALQTEARDAGLPRIEFYGRRVPDEFYRRSAIFFMTSAFEGFPNTLVEAQSYGCIPVIFDSYPVARWIVEGGANGHLVQPFDVDAMSERIVALARNPERNRIADQVLESARRFQIDRVGRMWQELFEAEVPLRLKEHEIEPAA